MIAVVAAAAVLAAGCDLVFPPGGGPIDASRVDDAPPDVDGADLIDSDPGAPDSSAPDAEVPCAFACYAADAIAGEPNPLNPGVAACETVPDDVCALYPEVELLDICKCSTGDLPELYLRVNGNDGLIAFVASPPQASWSIKINGGGCLGGGTACSTVAPCLAGSFIYVWDVFVLPGATNRFEIYDDAGSGCVPSPAWVFTIPL